MFLLPSQHAQRINLSHNFEAIIVLNVLNEILM